MANILNCPAPGCPFRFDGSLVPVNAVIACPQCGLQFTLSTLIAAAAPAGDSRAPRRVKARTAQGRVSNQGFLIAAVVVGLVALGLGGFFLMATLFGWFVKVELPVAPRSAGAKFESYGVTIPSPPAPWAKDDATRTSFGSNLLVYKREKPDGWIAYEARKVEYAAKATELKPKMMERLKKQFAELDESLEPTDATLMGFPAQKYEFGGVYKATGVSCRGEVYACVTKNFMYWMYAWWQKDDFTDTLSVDFMRQELAFNGGASLTVKAKPAEKTFRSRSGVYQLSDTEGLWTLQPDPTLQDAQADLFLKGVGKNPATNRAGSEKANLAVVILKPDGSAKEQALAHILKNYTPGAEIAELTQPSDAEAPSTGEVAVADHVARLALTYPGSESSANMLIVYSVLEVSGRRILAYADTPLTQKGYWDQRLMLIVGSLAASQ